MGAKLQRKKPEMFYINLLDLSKRFQANVADKTLIY